ETQRMTPFELERACGAVALIALFTPPVRHRLNGDGGQHVRKLGHVRTACRAAKAPLDSVAKAFEQVHSDQPLTFGLDRHAVLLVWRGIVCCLGGRDGEAFVERNAKMHVMHGLTGTTHTIRAILDGKIVMLEINEL